MDTKNIGPIGVFDSGYGGLTILKEIKAVLSEYDYLYLGDNARAPYGSRSFETIYQYTLECVKWFFEKNCPLIILACNTASAKALRTIQQNDLQSMAPGNRILGVIRPTTEIVGTYSKTKAIGILGTSGTVQSHSYAIEINKFFPGVRVYQQACPLWVPLIENNEHLSDGADYFIKKGIDHLLAQCDEIDTILLACTHYPLLADKLSRYIPKGIKLVFQGQIVAQSLSKYLILHPDLALRCTKNGETSFYTTDNPEDFNNHSSSFYGTPIQAHYVSL